MDADSRVSVRASTPLRVGLTISALGLLLGSTPVSRSFLKADAENFKVVFKL